MALFKTININKVMFRAKDENAMPTLSYFELMMITNNLDKEKNY